MIPAFQESGIWFGPFEEEDCFVLEKCRTFKAFKDGIKMAEFASTDGKHVFVVEAKSSSPNPENGEHFSVFIDPISEKIVNGLCLLFAVHLERHAQTDPLLPGALAGIVQNGGPLILVLIMRDHPRKALFVLQEALRKSLTRWIRLFNLGPNSVVVLNGEMACQKGIASSIQRDQPSDTPIS